MAVQEDDGSTNLLFYVGAIGEDEYLLLKHVVVPPEHAGIFARPADPVVTQPPAAVALTLPEDNEHL